MNPKDMELEDRQESEVRQKEGGDGGGVGDDESNRAPSGEDQAALLQLLLEADARLNKEKKESDQEKNELKREFQKLNEEKKVSDQETNEMKQEFQKLNEEKKERQRQLEANARLNQEMKESEQEKKELEQKKHELEQKNQELDTDYSVKELLETHGGIPLKKKHSCEPFSGWRAECQEYSRAQPSGTWCSSWSI